LKSRDRPAPPHGGRRAAAVVELIELAVETEQRSEDLRVEKLDDRVDLVDAILDWCPGQ